jgi:choline monooxygenase
MSPHREPDLEAREPASDPRIARELGRFRSELPVEEATTPPSSWYTLPGFLELEARTVFRRSWQYACPLEKLPGPGSFVRVDLLGQSYLVLRDEHGELRGFHNVCRHHAAQLLSGAGQVERLVCPYHGWTYGLDGALRSAPNMGAIRDFERERFGLPGVPVEAWGPLVFLHPDRPERPLGQELSPLLERLGTFGLDRLRHVQRRSYPIECDWKVYVDNYLDGGYHVAHLHRGLAGQLDLTGYRTELFERFSIQSCPGSAAPAAEACADFRERIGSGALYAWIHPNLMLNRYGPVLDTNWVVPLGPGRCLVVFDFWFEESADEGAQAFIQRSLAASDVVQQEDVAISESVQRGLRSSSYDTGRYARVEQAMHHFHRLLAADLRSAEQ